MPYKIFFYKKINSTNDVAIKKIKKGIVRGLVVADLQKKGRGQRGKKWISYNGNLFVSIFFKIKKKNILKKITYKNCAKIKKIISKIIKKKLRIKKPNDLLLNNKKICGLLQETIVFKDDLFLVLGIGVNLVKNPEIKHYPASNIFDETGIKVSKKLLIKHMLSEFKFN